MVTALKNQTPNLPSQQGVLTSLVHHAKSTLTPLNGGKTSNPLRSELHLQKEHYCSLLDIDDQ
jgi:hypothetical protein